MGIFTNDAWFDGTAFPELHLSMAPFRAIENRIAVFRCANGGFTCVVDKFGRIMTPLVTPDTTKETLVASVPLRSSTGQSQTLYTRYGDWFPMLCAIICVGGFRHPNRDTTAASTCLAVIRLPLQAGFATPQLKAAHKSGFPCRRGLQPRC